MFFYVDIREFHSSMKESGVPTSNKSFTFSTTVAEKGFSDLDKKWQRSCNLQVSLEMQG